MAQFAKILGTTLSAAALVSAIPSQNAPTMAKRDDCTFTDAASAIASQANCSSITLSNIVVPAGVTLDLSDLASGTEVIFDGETTFEYEEWTGPLISISGDAITVSGAEGNSLNGDGARWWDGEGGNGGVDKPKFFQAHSLTGGSVIKDLNILNTPVHTFSIGDCDGLTLSGITIDNSAGDTDKLGHNTDAFDVGTSNDVTITGANVQNQDDCLAVNSGTSITFTEGSCSGGHGLSIGSVGGRDDNTVSNILISSSSITKSANGIRIKTVSDATGEVSNVTYQDIELSEISNYGIVIEQDYLNGGPTGDPTTGVPITGLMISGVTGSVDDDAAPIYILCGDGSCSDWTWTGVDISGGAASTGCQGVPDGVSC